MTDTRKEFEKAMRFSEEFRDGNIYQFSFMTAAWQSWQACQSLNDKRIEQLLAVIEKQRELFYVIADYAHKPDFVMSQVNEALALQPSDVELVEVGRWVDEGNSDESDFYPVSYCGREGSGEMCYTIKKKE